MAWFRNKAEGPHRIFWESQLPKADLSIVLFVSQSWSIFSDGQKAWWFVPVLIGFHPSAKWILSIHSNSRFCFERSPFKSLSAAISKIFAEICAARGRDGRVLRRMHWESEPAVHVRCVWRAWEGTSWSLVFPSNRDEKGNLKLPLRHWSRQKEHACSAKSTCLAPQTTQTRVVCLRSAGKAAAAETKTPPKKRDSSTIKKDIKAGKKADGRFRGSVPGAWNPKKTIH